MKVRNNEEFFSRVLSRNDSSLRGIVAKKKFWRSAVVRSLLDAVHTPAIQPFSAPLGLAKYERLGIGIAPQYVMDVLSRVRLLAPHCTEPRHGGAERWIGEEWHR